MQRPVVMALVWFFCLGGLGIWFPFYTLYLKENAGLSGTQVGLVMATLPLVGILGQPFWGQVADRTGSRTRLLSLLALCAAAGYAALTLPESFAGFVVATAALALFSTSLIPSCVSVTLALGREGGVRAFGRTRVWARWASWYRCSRFRSCSTPGSPATAWKRCAANRSPHPGSRSCSRSRRSSWP